LPKFVKKKLEDAAASPAFSALMPLGGGKNILTFPPTKRREFEAKNRSKSVEEAKAESMLLLFCSFSTVIKRL